MPTQAKPMTNKPEIEVPSQTRQERRKEERDLNKKQKQFLKKLESPVSHRELYGVTQYLETTIAVMDSFIESKFGEEYSNYIKDQMNKEKEKLGVKAKENTPEEEQKEA